MTHALYISGQYIRSFPSMREARAYPTGGLISVIVAL